MTCPSCEREGVTPHCPFCGRTPMSEEHEDGRSGSREPGAGFGRRGGRLARWGAILASAIVASVATMTVVVVRDHLSNETQSGDSTFAIRDGEARTPPAEEDVDYEDDGAAAEVNWAYAWCQHRMILNSSASLFDYVYGQVLASGREISAANIVAGMAYGGSLHASYRGYVRRGWLPSDIEDDLTSVMMMYAERWSEDGWNAKVTASRIMPHCA